MSKEVTIDYFVNGEVESTHEKKLTVRQILESAGFEPASDYTLTRDEGHHDFTDQDQEVPLHKHERFTATFNGPTPTSHDSR